MRPVAEQLRVLLDGADQALPEGRLEQQVAAVVAGERGPLRVKLGLDPTKPDLHLGHTVVLRKLRDFQRMGHTAVLIIGGFTAQVGDPTGRSTTRPRLTAEQVAEHAATYLAQAGTVLLPERLEVVDNSTWLAPMALPDVLGLTAQMTVARMLERKDFGDRLRDGRPIAILEFLYPLLQGRDSVEVRADVELGGTDQTFNLLVGRVLQEAAGQSPQSVLTVPLIEGLDGVKKMSKTEGNAIGVTDPPAEMFGAVMSIPDALMPRWYRLLTDVAPDEVDAIAAEVPSADGPRRGELKRRLAREIVGIYHSAAAAEAAEARFDVQFRDRAVPADVPDFTLGAAAEWFLPTLLQDALGLSSGAEARRSVTAGSVRLDGEPLRDPTATLPVEALRGRVLQAGRRRFARLV